MVIILVSGSRYVVTEAQRTLNKLYFYHNKKYFAVDNDKVFTIELVVY